MNIEKNINDFNSFYKFVKDIYENGFEIFLHQGSYKAEKHKLSGYNLNGTPRLSSAIGFNLTENYWNEFNVKVYYDRDGIPIKLITDAPEIEYFISYGIQVIVSGLQWKEKENETLNLPSIVFVSANIRNEALIHEDYISFEVGIKLQETYGRSLKTDIPHIEKCSMIHGLIDDKIMYLHLNTFEYACKRYGHLEPK